MDDRIRIKVCGMRQTRNIKELVELMPDYIGFIFYPKSPRFAGKILDAAITADIPETIKKTGVFVNAPTQTIDETGIKYHLNAVQLHGQETPAQCRELRNRGYEVIKTFSIKEKADIGQTKTYAEFCDYFLFDTPTLKYGGSGNKFDWSVLEGTSIERPFFLGGGIEENDAMALINECPQRPYAIDINSRFETTPGEKDIASVGRFMNSIKNENRLF
ncbi:MAG: phosphoribosylanthranilate isomerase [Marinilabilia sp.]